MFPRTSVSPPYPSLATSDHQVPNPPLPLIISLQWALISKPLQVFCFLGTLSSSLSTPLPCTACSPPSQVPLTPQWPHSHRQGLRVLPSLCPWPPPRPNPVWVLLSKGCPSSFPGTAHKRPWELFLGTFSRHTRSTMGLCSKEPVFIRLQT